MKRLRCAVLSVLVLLTASDAVFGQNAGVQGVVTDPSGAYIPQVTVTVTNLATGIVTTVASNEQGFYSVPFLSPGNYKIEAMQVGFAPQTRMDLKIDVNQVARVDFTLRIGNVAETVEVTAAAALLESETTNAAFSPGSLRLQQSAHVREAQ